MAIGRCNRTEDEWIEIDNKRYRTWYDGAGIILFNSCNEVLLVQDTFSKRWSFPKGRVEIDDLDIPINTAIRETLEEAGLQHLIDYTLSSYDPIMIRFNTHFFKATLLENSNTPSTDGDNECSFRWASFHEITNTLWNHTNNYIKYFVSTFS